MSSEVKALGEICKIKQGKYLSPSEMAEVATPEKSIPVVGGNGILGYTDRPSHTTDVALITCRGSKCGLIQWAPAPVWVSNNAMACDTGTLLGNRFLRYLFGSTGFEDVITGSAQPQITIGHLSKKEFAVCSESEWPNIVEMLGTLDDRISLLRETNQTLEAIAQALFKSWFVDFDPVRAKAEGKLPEGIDAATAELFPDGFEESELGVVPKGWAVTSVGAIAEVVKGKSYSSKDLVENHKTALVTLKSFERGGGFRMDGFKPYSGTYKPTQVVSAGDLIVAYTDVTQAAELIGKPAIVVAVEEHDTLVASLDVGILRPDIKKCGRQFLYGLFKTDSFQSHTFAHTSGTTVLHLSKDGVGSFTFPLPPIEIVQKFEKIASAIAERNQINADEIRTLGALRDTLLPRLISGQLRIAGAETELEKAKA
jgi:type I restriction enzyme S subunit